MIFFLIICTLIIVAYCLLLLFQYSGFKEEVISSDSAADVFVTVIIPVRNEEKYITALLDALALQEYPSSLLEVLVVNDHSDDATTALVTAYIKGNKLKQLQILHLEKTTGKKQAITHGVNHAKGELIITTDADCTMGSKWCLTIAQVYQEIKPSMIVAPVSISGEEGIINDWQQLEYIAMQVCGGGSLKKGKPLLCSGANIAFSKVAFQELNGYEGNENIASGDDTFLMLKMYEKYGAPYALINDKANVVSAPLMNTAGIVNQRIRWGEKIRYYNSNYIKLTGLVVLLCNIVFVLSLPALFAGWFLPFLVVVPLKLLVDYLILKKGIHYFHFDRKSSLMPSLLLYPVLFLFITLSSFKGKYEWKGRTYNQ
ncbi:MAG: glycosyltransferase [Bacteroidota bacterium]